MEKKEAREVAARIIAGWEADGLTIGDAAEIVHAMSSYLYVSENRIREDLQKTALKDNPVRFNEALECLDALYPDDEEEDE